MLISFAVTAKLICVFVFAYAKIRFSHEATHIVGEIGHVKKSYEKNRQDVCLVIINKVCFSEVLLKNICFWYPQYMILWRNNENNFLNYRQERFLISVSLFYHKNDNEDSRATAFQVPDFSGYFCD